MAEHHADARRRHEREQRRGQQSHQRCVDEHNDKDKWSVFIRSNYSLILFLDNSRALSTNRPNAAPSADPPQTAPPNVRQSNIEQIGSLADDGAPPRSTASVQPQPSSADRRQSTTTNAGILREDAVQKDVQGIRSAGRRTKEYHVVPASMESFGR